MSPTTLLTLPAEIVELICAQFCVHCTANPHLDHPGRIRNAHDPPQRRWPDTTALVRLSQTCRTLQQIATPLIYHEFDLGHWHLGQVAGFVTTIRRDPKFAAFVRHITISEFFHIGPEWATIKEEAIKHDLQFPGHWVPLVSHVVADRLPRLELEEQLGLSEQVLVDLILSHCWTNVEKLDIEVNKWAEHGALLPTSTRFPGLKELSITWYHHDVRDSDVVYGLPNFSELLWRAPVLERLHLRNCFTLFPDDDLREEPLALWNLKWLQLDNTIISNEDLQALTATCQELETFIYDCNVSDKEILEASEPSSPSEIQQAIFHCKDTLRHLVIHYGRIHLQYPHLGGSIGSMKEFTVLETVALDAECLYRSPDNNSQGNTEDGAFEDANPAISLVDLLPTSVQTVIIAGNHPRLYEDKLKLAKEVSRGTFPHLKVFQETGLNLEPPLQPLKDAMKEAGVSFYHLPSDEFES